MEITAQTVKQWRNGAKGFLQWLQDVKPRIAGNKGRFIPFQAAQFQIDTIQDALAMEGGKWKYQTLCFSFPRRHSKTTLMALLVLWRFLLFPHENIKILANSFEQGANVAFSLVKSAILNTPAILAEIGAANVLATEIRNVKLQGRIEVVASNAPSLYGQKITVGWVSEIHAAQDDSAMQVIASSLGDTQNSWLLLDSTVDAIGGPIHRLEQLAATGEDATVFVKRIEYRDLQDALEHCPEWIDKRWLASRAKQLLPVEFATQHLNQRASATNNLFSLVDIQAAKEDMPAQFTSLELDVLAAKRRYVIGGGLDRAYFASLHGDKTIWTSIAKIADENGNDPHFYILNQKDIFGSLGISIKKAIARDNELYKFSNICIEAYNSQDIALWAMEQSIPCEIIHATNNNQIPAFTDLHRIVAEKRLHFSNKLDGLATELETFTYILKGDTPKFGDNKWHDDRVYSLAWAIFSLREREIIAYELPDIICNSKSRNSSLCYLRCGDLILPCSQSCKSHIECNAIYLQYKTHNVESTITLPDFYKNKVTVGGVKTYRAI